MLIVWPERRAVSDEWIAMQYSDAVANGDCDAGMVSVGDMAAELHEAGLITLSRSIAY